MIMVKETLSERRYKAGYVVRDQVYEGADFGGEDFSYKTAYNFNGDYIGSSRRAHNLCVKRGIKPELISPTHNVCSIGFNEEEQKWYGWSHRAIYGFGVGSVVVKGDIGYVPSTHDEMWESLRGMFEAIPVEERTGDCYFDPNIRNLNISKLEGQLVIQFERGMQQYETAKDGEQIPTTTTSWESFEEVYKLGRGKWTAETLVDVKQMAINFANDIA